MGNYSPLRYPGGKSALYPAISGIIKSNKMDHCIYVSLINELPESLKESSPFCILL